MEKETMELQDACWAIFAGVGACSPELYQAGLEAIAKKTGRVLDDNFREDVLNVLAQYTFCPLD